MSSGAHLPRVFGPLGLVLLTCLVGLVAAGKPPASAFGLPVETPQLCRNDHDCDGSDFCGVPLVREFGGGDENARQYSDQRTAWLKRRRSEDPSPECMSCAACVPHSHHRPFAPVPLLGGVERLGSLCIDAFSQRKLHFHSDKCEFNFEL